jgi:predicted ABC-type ATPase
LVRVDDLALIQPSIVVLAGPNGAGKTTAAPFLLRDALAVREYVNADPIAQGLSAFNPEAVAIAAGRLMLARLNELARQRMSFGFETTLASRSFAPWLRLRLEDGYSVHLVFLWLASPELAVARVARRVALGGHSVPEEVVRRRYVAGVGNFFQLYRPLVSSWRLFDNSAPSAPTLIARGMHDETRVIEPQMWESIVRQWAEPHG